MQRPKSDSVSNGVTAASAQTKDDRECFVVVIVVSSFILNNSRFLVKVWSTHPVVVPILKDVDQREKMRQENIHEMYLAEKAYVNDLNLVIVVCSFFFFLFSSLPEI